LRGPLHPLWTAMIAALGTVLVVDDDAVLRSSLESVLGDLGYRVLSTGSPDVAYQLLGTESALAVLLDVRLPTMSGLSLYLAMTHRWPRLHGRVALMTADADAPDVRTWSKRNPCTVIRKPFTFREITGWLDAVAHPLDGPATAGERLPGRRDRHRHGRAGNRQVRRPCSDRLERHRRRAAIRF